MKGVCASALSVALACLHLTSAQAQSPPTQAPVDKARVVAACAQETVLPNGVTADAAAVTAYCQCAIDLAAEILTPQEFDIFGRYGLSRAGMGPPPSQAEMAASDTIEFGARIVRHRDLVRSQCYSSLGLSPN